VPRLPSYIFQELMDRCNGYDLAVLIQADLGAPKIAKGKDLYWLCPDHSDHSPSLHLNRRKNAAYCNVCGKRWSPLKWVMARQKLKLMEAVEYITGQPVARAEVVAPAQVDKPYAPPSADWQSRAENVINYCVANLWVDTPEAERVRAYLHRRGLKDATLRQWEVGYNPRGQDLHGAWVWPGIILPARMQGVVWGIKIRLLPDHPFSCLACKACLTAPGCCPKCGKKNKYRQVAGSEPALYGADLCVGRRVCFGLEGEFDAMLAWQECADLGGVFTSTNGASKDWRAEWSLHLMDAEVVITLFDNDDAGAMGKAKLIGLGERIVPANVPHGKDVTDYYIHGGPLYSWLAQARQNVLAHRFLGSEDQIAYLQSRLALPLPVQLLEDYRSDIADLGKDCRRPSSEMALQALSVESSDERSLSPALVQEELI